MNNDGITVGVNVEEEGSGVEIGITTDTTSPHRPQ